jgi:aminobenzoyl-glutamate utilization protein B
MSEVNTGALKSRVIGADDKPPLDLNQDSMARFRPLMQPFYYDANKYDTYLDQLGVVYPTLERPS